MKTDTIAVRVDHVLKAQLEELFRSLGMTLSEAVTIFLHKAVQAGGIPFPVTRSLSQETVDAIGEVKALINSGAPGVSWAEMRADLLNGSDDDDA